MLIEDYVSDEEREARRLRVEAEIDRYEREFPAHVRALHDAGLHRELLEEYCHEGLSVCLSSGRAYICSREEKFPKREVPERFRSEPTLLELTPFEDWPPAIADAVRRLSAYCVREAEAGAFGC